ncbi:SpaA isopeptide-forming pilin-related protein [Lactiplantibacillus modestisalitolerans]|uniref:SpaA isopeptide-forming pilin-related protein n=1 Tax=Lactiplantibacillus modestisalitolerans TaxID=1457219 RepID=A0ABV5WVW8_9LACO|nr:SpaA isopeptide-forming pilin-related protein [Lactiplantibacillus modestisalitolerans]
MRAKLFTALLGLLTVIATVFALGSVARADEIPALGLTGSDATVTDRYGHVITDTNTLSKWEDYTVQYNWSIRDGQPIADGDTTTVTLPNGAVAPVNLSFPLKDNNGRVVGTFAIQAGQTTGTITFNDALSQTGTNRTGTLQFFAKGTVDNDVHFDWSINKIGWIGDYDANGLPSTLAWNVAFNPTGQNLGTVTVTDTLGPNQTFIPGSVVAQTGSYNDVGNFIQSGTTTPTVAVNGNQITFTFHDITTAVNMVYNVQLANVTENSNNWTNSASMNGVTISSNVSYGGDGTGNGEDHLGSIMLLKEDADTKAPLSGAEYELQDSAGNVIQSGLTTNANGELIISNLRLGNYQLVETKAPTGYQLDSTPIPFTIDLNTARELTDLTQSNQKLPVAPTTGEVVLTKTAFDTQEPLAGAVYQLTDGTGQVLKTGLTTDQTGQLSVAGLAPGDYQFVETQAPTGYQLNATPIKFTITSGQTAPVKVSATNQPIEAAPGEPGNPGTTEPENPGTTEPENPGTTEPENPGTTEPENPGTTEPENPGTTEPENPGTSQPGTTEPGTTAPGTSTPGTTGPAQPGTGEPDLGQPETPAPATPAPAKPQPAPSQPAPTTPTVPGVTAPATGASQAGSTATIGQTGQASSNGSAATVNGQRPANAITPAVNQLPQTGERRSQPLAVVVGLALLLMLIGFSVYTVRRQG